MTIEKAIKTAIEYEIKVRDAYLDNLDTIKDEMGRLVFESLGKEEQGHIVYLEARLVEWQKSGKITSATLETVVPAREKIESGMRKLENTLVERDYGTEREMLSKAIRLEQETSDFYHKLVDEMGEEGRLFKRFLEIEDGHLAIVQAELDYLTKTGCFFDFQEFNLEY